MSNRQPNFQQAMEITAAWLQQWENEEISDEVLADRVGEMVASRDGARGFFVVSRRAPTRRRPSANSSTTIFSLV